MQYQDGTKPSNFKQMSKEEREWLEEAMKQYTFNDVDRLTELVDELKNDMTKTKEEQLSNEDLLEKLEELLELVELHPRNNQNLCLCGGMQIVMAYILQHPHAGVR